MTTLSGKIALITGGGAGIGAATARRFVAEGARVVITDINDEDGNRVAKEIGENCRFIHADHRIRAHNDDAVRLAVETWGELNILFNNAGTPLRGKFDDIDDQTIERLLSINIAGPIRMTQAALPALRESAKRRQGAILFTASIQSLMVRPHYTLYGATKHGIAGLLSSLALELATENIRVNGVGPGPVNTQLLRTSVAVAAKTHNINMDAAYEMFKGNVPMRQLIEPEDIANAASFLCSDAARLITGVVLPVDGGICAR
ncbi:MAG: glucose 1-dehydrogenase [Parvibaculum sp.]|uniref:SDR family NAD(P)-dependent oxidoreductase n=1 Tax=Parvibaculum sp. TaxID=2024848 RepID=UPI003C74EC8C